VLCTEETPAMDQYAVNTALPTNSTEIRELAALLHDSNSMEFDEKIFIATLQPKDIKSELHDFDID